MTKQITKYGSLITAILFAMWLGKEPSYEPFIGLIVSIGGFIWPDLHDFIKSHSPKAFKHDKDVYSAIVKAFEENRLLSFLREANFTLSYPSEYGECLMAIEEGFQPPQYELWDKKLERLRKELFNSISYLTHRLAYDTYPSSVRDNRHTAIPDICVGSLEPLPKEIDERIQKLHKLTEEVLSKFSVFYKEGGKKLNLNKP